MKAHWKYVATAALMIVCTAQAQEQAQAQTAAEEALAKQSGCFDCHSIDRKADQITPDKKLIGPAFRDIAAKYKSNERARAALVETVKRGGKGNWTEAVGAPMPPYSPRLSDAEIKRLVDWALSL
jgi:cytochrome c